MAIFTKDQKVKRLAPTKGQQVGIDKLTDIVSAPDPTLPTLGTAELSPVQQEVQRMLGGSAQSIEEAAILATSRFRDILNDQSDPLSSQGFESFRRLKEDQKTGQITANRQAAQFGRGSTRSTPALGVESDTRRQFDLETSDEATRLIERQQDRKDNAAVGIQAAVAEGVRGLSEVTAAADIERQIESQRATALYQQALAQIMFPYDKVAGIAESLMNRRPDTVVTGGGLTDLGFVVSAGASALGSFVGGGGTFGDTGRKVT